MLHVNDLGKSDEFTKRYMNLVQCLVDNIQIKETKNTVLFQRF